MVSPGSRPMPRQGVRVDVHTRGELDPAFISIIREAVAAVVAASANAAGPVRLRFTAGDCAPGPTILQVNLRVRGEPARIQLAARTPQAAAVAAIDRLERQIRRLGLRLDLTAWPLPFRRRLALPGEAAIARLKAVRLQVATAAEAAMRLSAMDYDAHLFTDTDTGDDAVIYCTGSEQLRLARQHTAPSLQAVPAIRVDSRAAFVLDAAQAARRLAATAVPFVFYTDRDTGRGNLLYRRYDGDLGLISPATVDAASEQTRALDARVDAAFPAGYCGSQPSRDEAVGVLLEIANSRTASARSRTAAAR
ncbi:sigma 54 modulation/S30EA ribosomal C-terminal domain-containing protein [Catellatospora sp. NPDC049133]|uniref:sigma 54 modulation/S30EA ribosomal C-terminal domain-containing protein n=1 Tax=Catellatospora sp. NPDC049133 TaxID=3155499 RepID=UPI0033DD93AB